jgi:hypothetical protein
MGWLYLHDAIIKWRSRSAYSSRGKYDNGGQNPLWVDNDWLMQFERAVSLREGLLDPAYLFSPAARDSLTDKLKTVGKFTRKEETFNFINVDWPDYRKYAFQGKPLFGEDAPVKAIRLLLVINNQVTPDGLQAALGNFTLYALASGKVIPLGNGKYDIIINKVGTFTHDGFDFDGDQHLGNWAYDRRDKGVGIIKNTWMENKHFRSFRERTGYGCDFRLMSKPIIDSIGEYKYTYDSNHGEPEHE